MNTLCWPATLSRFRFHHKHIWWGWGQDCVQASQVHPHQTLQFMSAWTLAHISEPMCPHTFGHSLVYCILSYLSNMFPIWVCKQIRAIPIVFFSLVELKQEESKMRAHPAVLLSVFPIHSEYFHIPATTGGVSARSVQYLLFIKCIFICRLILSLWRVILWLTMKINVLLSRCALAAERFPPFTPRGILSDGVQTRGV